MHRYVICGLWTVAIFIGLTAAVGQQTRPTTAAATTTPMKITHLITDHASGFTLNYPIDWKQFEVLSNPSIKTLLRPTADAGIELRVMVNSTRYKPDQVKKITDDVELAIKAADATLVSNDPMTLGGVAARKVIFDRPAKGNDAASRQVDIFAIANDRQYAITFTAPRDQFDKFMTAGVDDVIASFEFVPVVAAAQPASRPASGANTQPFGTLPFTRPS